MEAEAEKKASEILMRTVTEIFDQEDVVFAREMGRLVCHVRLSVEGTDKLCEKCEVAAIDKMISMMALETEIILKIVMKLASDKGVVEKARELYLQWKSAKTPGRIITMRTLAGDLLFRFTDKEKEIYSLLLERKIKSLPPYVILTLELERSVADEENKELWNARGAAGITSVPVYAPNFKPGEKLTLPEVENYMISNTKKFFNM